MYLMKPYDDLLKDILDNGFRKKNRTGVDTLNIFGTQQRYRIDTHFPLLTGRKVWLKSIFAELLWILSGSTNVRDLQKLGSHIWDKWENRKFEKQNRYIEGSLGPIYGFQLRDFNGLYKDGKTIPLLSSPDDHPNMFNGLGFDQLHYMVETLKTDPDSRRNLFNLWNPEHMAGNMVSIPCCHYSFQIYTNKNRLYGMLTQRSADTPVGVPANIQFYSTLLYLLAKEANLIPYELIHSIGVAHIYNNQINGVLEYLNRTKPDSPKLEISRRKSLVETDGVNPGGYLLEDFNVIDYNPQLPIKIPVLL